MKKKIALVLTLLLSVMLSFSSNSSRKYAVDKKVLLCTCLNTIKVNVDMVEFNHPNLEGVFRVIEEEGELHLYFEEDLIAGFIEKFDYSIESEGDGLVIYRLNKKGRIMDEYHLIPSLNGDESLEFVLLRPNDRMMHQ